MGQKGLHSRSSRNRQLFSKLSEIAPSRKNDKFHTILYIIFTLLGDGAAVIFMRTLTRRPGQPPLDLGDQMP
jgi:hypothetical protein